MHPVHLGSGSEATPPGLLLAHSGGRLAVGLSTAAASTGLDSSLFAATLAKAAEGLLPRGTPGGSGGFHFSPLSGRSVGAWGCAWLSSEICQDPARQAAGRHCRAAAWRLAPRPALLWFPLQVWGPGCPVSGPLSAPAKPRGLRGAGAGAGRGDRDRVCPALSLAWGLNTAPTPGCPAPACLPTAGACLSPWVGAGVGALLRDPSLPLSGQLAPSEMSVVPARLCPTPWGSWGGGGVGHLWTPPPTSSGLEARRGHSRSGREPKPLLSHGTGSVLTPCNGDSGLHVMDPILSGGQGPAVP